MKVVFDSGILMNLDRLPKLEGEFYTTNSAVNELRSHQAKTMFDIFTATNKITIMDPESDYLRIVGDKSDNIGQIRLSNPDMEILAVALMLNADADVLLLSDDYGLRNVAHELGLKSKGVKTEGGTELRKYRYMCIACKNIYNSRIEDCDICGNPTFIRTKR